MLFPTVTFAAFFVTVYALHLALLRRAQAWKLAMTAASYVFYGWWDWRFCGLLAGCTLANWMLARAAARSRRGRPARARGLVAVGVAANLAVLGLFKYYDFAAQALAGPLSRVPLAHGVRLPALELVLPIGISFFTFQAISYLVDVGRGELAPAALIDFGLYLSFFPHLVAGPIVRASELLPQLGERRLAPVDVERAAWLIGRGLVKKVVVSSFLATAVVDPVFAAPSVASRPALIGALYGYAVQIYADFSGYTDMAIGLAALLGIALPLNFDRPYRACSLQDFWRRWHLSLSRWLRDYLYIPLGGNRGSERATYRNLVLTMVLGGLWHGAAWTFVLWGAVHGVALVLERVVERVAEKTAARSAGRTPGSVAGRVAAARWWPAARWLVTFHLVCLAWIPFRASGLGPAGQFALGLLRAPWRGPVPVAGLALVAAAVAAQLLPPDGGRRVREALARLHPVAQSGLAGVFLLLVVSLGPSGVAPFIYFRF